MTIQKLVQILHARPGYLKSGPSYIARKFKVSLQDATSALKAARSERKKVFR